MFLTINVFIYCEQILFLQFHCAITYSFITNLIIAGPKISLVAAFGSILFSLEIEITNFIVHVHKWCYVSSNKLLPGGKRAGFRIPNVILWTLFILKYFIFSYSVTVFDKNNFTLSIFCKRFRFVLSNRLGKCSCLPYKYYFINVSIEF